MESITKLFKMIFDVLLNTWQKKIIAAVVIAFVVKSYLASLLIVLVLLWIGYDWFNKKPE